MKECSEGEEAYFRTYPDVAKKFIKRTAFRHWKRFGKNEGRHYICDCPNSEGRFVSAQNKKYDNGFIVVGIFKNEAMIFAEWISHYLWQGASHFYLIDNGSTDDWISTIPPEIHARITVTNYEGKYVQRKSYNFLLPMLQKKHPKDCVLVVDCDEFLYAKQPHIIASYLSTIANDIGEVRTAW